jgi:hypothetical protein
VLVYGRKHMALFKVKARQQGTLQLRQPFDNPVPLAGIPCVRPGRELRLAVNRQVGDEATLLFHGVNQEIAQFSPAAQDRPEQPVLACRPAPRDRCSGRNLPSRCTFCAIDPARRQARMHESYDLKRGRVIALSHTRHRNLTARRPLGPLAAKTWWAQLGSNQ